MCGQRIKPRSSAYKTGGLLTELSSQPLDARLDCSVGGLVAAAAACCEIPFSGRQEVRRHRANDIRLGEIPIQLFIVKKGLGFL